MRDVELEEIKEYAAEDADITFQLKNYFRRIGKKTDKETFEEIEPW
jgi:DNA polymerase-1